MKLEELGEFGLIERIRALATADPSLVLGIGDDTAAIRPTPGHLLLATCDTLVEGRHFIASRISAEQLGRRLAAVNLSDIASMGGRPRWALASLALPADTDVEFVEDLYRGLVAELGRFGALIAGGNLTSGAELLLDLTLLGEAPPGQILRRDGAHVGDAILVSGTLGAAAAGRAALDAQKGTGDRKQGTDALSRSGRTDAQTRDFTHGRPRAAQRPRSRADSDVASLIATHLVPEPRIAAGQAIAASGLASAMLDVSDGLAQDLGHICDASGVGAVVEAARLPIGDATRSVAERLGLDLLALALGGGEDYELLLTTSAAHAPELAALVQQETGVRLTQIGWIVPAVDGRMLIQADGRIEPLPTRGWQHFGL